MLKKYAMVPINRRYDNEGNRIVRRILISYKKRVEGIYKGTKVLELDPYFKDENSSQQYVFENKCFYLVKDHYNDPIQDTLLLVKRPYEYDAGRLTEKSIEFKAESDDEAIKLFNERG